MDTETPEKTRHIMTEQHSANIATSSRYILDRPKTSEEALSKDCNEAMNILRFISPIRGNSMTFRRERETSNQPYQKNTKDHQDDQRKDDGTKTEEKDKKESNKDSEKN